MIIRRCEGREEGKRGGGQKGQMASMFRDRANRSGSIDKDVVGINYSCVHPVVG